MKLIREITEDYQVRKVNEDNGPPRYFIEGVFMQGNVKNRNGRVYPVEMLEEKVTNYIEGYVNANRAFGELGHPSTPTVDGKNVCMRIVELSRNGNDFVGKAQISKTPNGAIVEGLLSDGGRLGVSSRGLGSLKSVSGVQEVQNDYFIAAVDVVLDPSAPDAFVNALMEDVDWIYANDTWIPSYIDRARKTIKKTPKSNLEEVGIRLMENFFNRL